LKKKELVTNKLQLKIKVIKLNMIKCLK